MRRARNITRAPRGMTMVEILVALGILAVAIGSILTIFHAGARHGARAREKLEAGRVALAVFDLVDKGFTITSTPHGRGSDGVVLDETISSGNHLQNIDEGQSAWRPTYVADSPVPLVWKYDINPYTVDGVPMHRLSVTVAVDEDRDLQFSSGDREIRTYEAILADRRVTP